MIFHPFSRNEPLFATSCSKVDQNAEKWFTRKVARFGQINEFSCFFTKWTTFAEKLTKPTKHGSLVESSKFWPNRWVFVLFHEMGHFLLKSSPKRRHMVVSSKSCKFWPNRWFFVLFHDMSHFFQLFAEKLTKTSKHGRLLEKLQVLEKSMAFPAFSPNGPLFDEKFTKTPKHGSFLQKLLVLAKSMIFRAFSRHEPLFATFCWKVDRNAETW